MLDLDTVARAAQKVTPLPRTASRLLTILFDPSWRVEDVTGVFESDPALATRLLILANSARYGAREIATVKDAVIRVGRGSVMSLALSSVARAAYGPGVRVFGEDQESCWRHAVVASAAADLLRAQCQDVPQEAATAALIHDIGRSILADSIPPEWIRTIEVAKQSSGAPWVEIESEVLGVTHAEVGGIIAQHWGLPEILVQSVLYHHAPSQTTTSDASIQRACHAVCLANSLAHAHATPVLGAPGPEASDSMEVLGLDGDAVESIQKELAIAVDSFAAAFSDQ